jgi:hypothetical protein
MITGFADEASLATQTSSEANDEVSVFSFLSDNFHEDENNVGLEEDCKNDYEYEDEGEYSYYYEYTYECERYHGHAPRLQEVARESTRAREALSTPPSIKTRGFFFERLFNKR